MIWTLFAKKLVRSAVQAALAALGAERLAGVGITVDQTVLIAAVYAALEGLRQTAKRKWGWKVL